MDTQTNGNGETPVVELSEDKKVAVRAAVDYHSTQFNLVCEERDKLRQEIFVLKSEFALLKMEHEAQVTQIIEEKSKAVTAILDRDLAVRMCVQWETLFTQLDATMRAFNVPAAPFIKKAADETFDTFPRATVD